MSQILLMLSCGLWATTYNIQYDISMILSYNCYSINSSVKLQPHLYSPLCCKFGNNDHLAIDYNIGYNTR